MPDPTAPGRLRRAVRSPYAVAVGGAISLFIGISSMFALQKPPFLPTDETAHLGYAHEIADLELPEITKDPSVPESAIQWRAERASGRDDRYRAVWVANHPPLQYVIAAPLIWWSELTNRPDGGLVPLRLVNVAVAAVGVGFTYLLARDLSGGVRRIGLAAALIVALVPEGHARFGEAMNDGLGFTAATAVVWAGVRCLMRFRQPPQALKGATMGPPTTDRLGSTASPVGTRDLAILGAAAAACAGARVASLAVATTVVVWVAAHQLVAGGVGDARRRLLLAGRVVAIGLLPAMLLFGWFYVRTMALYGDLAASEFLLDRFDRQARGSVFEILTSGHRWISMYHGLLAAEPLLSVRATTAIVNPVAGLAVAGIALVAIVGRTGGRWAGKERVSREALALCVSTLFVVALTVVQHVSGGGSGYARYLFPGLGVAAALVALGLDRLIPRILPAVVVVVMAYWALKNLPVGINPRAVGRPRDRGSNMPEVLRVVPSAPWQRGVAVGLIVGGCLAATTALVAGRTSQRSRDSRPPTREAGGQAGGVKITEPL